MKLDPSEHRLCTPAQVAARLCCSKKTIERAMRRGDIAYKRIGDLRRIPEKEVRRLLEVGLPSRPDAT